MWRLIDITRFDSKNAVFWCRPVPCCPPWSRSIRSRSALFHAVFRVSSNWQFRLITDQFKRPVAARSLSWSLSPPKHRCHRRFQSRSASADLLEYCHCFLAATSESLKFVYRLPQDCSAVRQFDLTSVRAHRQFDNHSSSVPLLVQRSHDCRHVMVVAWRGVHRGVLSFNVLNACVYQVAYKEENFT